MQLDFHYYATYAAAILAGWSPEESLDIAWSAQFVDCCSRTYLAGSDAPVYAATTQTQVELADARTDILGLHDITRIWSSFHFLPRDLESKIRGKGKAYRDKYHLICGPNGDLLVETVKLAAGKGVQAAGIAMHVLADTWAHQHFAGTPSFVINNTNEFFYELLGEGEDAERRQIRFRPNPKAPEDLEKGLYTGTVYQMSENSIMNLGHGRAGHLPDYSFIRYMYLPAWGEYRVLIKDNPSDYYHAFCQMIRALRYLREENGTFAAGEYDFETAAPYQEEIMRIIRTRQTDASADWKAFGERLSGAVIPDFDETKHGHDYRHAGDKDATFLGMFIIAALAQKSMVTNKIFKSGNLLAGISVDFMEKGFRGIRDFRKLVEEAERRES